MGLNASAASETVRRLLETGLLRREGLQPSGGGRPREIVRVNPDAACAVGVHLGMRSVRALLTDASGAPLSEQAGGPAGSKPSDMIEAIASAVSGLLRQRDDRPLAGVGIGVSGVLRPEGRLTREFPHGERWQEVPLANEIERRCGTRPLLLNDVHAAALAELRLGHWPDVRNLVLLHLGDGIAVGLVLDGRLYRGATGNAGQVGHNVLVEDGPLCYCGNRGCMESLVSSRALIQSCRDAAARGVQTRVLDEAGAADRIALPHILSAAAQGDAFAANLLDQAGGYVGQTAARLINTFEPDLLLLSGLLAVPDSDLVETARRAARMRALPALRGGVRIDCGRLCEKGPALGAAAAALDEFFSDRERLRMTLSRQ